MYLNERVKDIFTQTKSRYASLQDVDVVLQFQKGLFFTMRASFSFRSLFKNQRKYVLKINTNRHKLFVQLDDEDITGWFAHELAHVVDYESMSNGELGIFTLKYIFNPRFRSFVEKRVNIIACKNGFTRELFGVWKTFLKMDVIPDFYKKYIMKNYLPSWTEVEPFARKIGVTKKEVIESVPEKYWQYFNDQE